MCHGFDFVLLLVCLFIFLRAGHPAIARSGKRSQAEVLACCQRAYGTLDLLGTQAHPGRNIDGSVLADLGCHPHIPQECLTGWTGNHTENVLEGVPRGVPGHSKWGEAESFLVGDHQVDLEG